MGVDHKLIRNSENFKGIDIRTSDLQRTMEYATDIENAVYRRTGAISKRKGFKVNLTQYENHFGSYTFRKTDPNSGATSDELIAISTELQRLVDDNFTVSYDGSSDLFASIVAENSANFKFILKDQDVTLFEQDLGTGFNSSDITLNAFKNKLNGVTIPVATITNIVAPTNTNEYTYTIPAYRVHKPISLVPGAYLKVSTENAILVVDSVTENIVTDPTTGQQNIDSYTFVLSGPSAALTSGTAAVELVEFYGVVANYTNSDLDNYRVALLNAEKDLPIVSSVEGGTTFRAKAWEDIPNGDPNLINVFNWKVDPSDQDRVFASEEIENASFTQLNNVLYVSNGYDDVVKYDGKYAYKAGLPALDIDNQPYFAVTAVTDSSNALHTGLSNPSTRIYEYRFVLEYTDAVGNIISSQPSQPQKINLNNNQRVDINWSVAGTDSMESLLEGRDLTGTFDSTHSLYSSLPALSITDERTYNSLSDRTSKYQTEKRMRVKIYRSKKYDPTSPAGEVVGQYYLIADLPYDYDSSENPINSSVKFSDNTPDENPTDLANELNTLIALNEPVKRQDPPPKGKYITGFKNCLVSAGNPKNTNNVTYSLPKNTSTGEIGSEYFPADDNAIIVDSLFGDKVTAIAPLRDLLYIFHKNSIHVLGGNINLLELPVVDLLTKEGGVGCNSHHSLEEFRNQLIFLSEEGVYTIDASNAVNELSSLIAPLFKDNLLKSKRAVCFNWVKENLMIMNIPKESKHISVDTIDTFTFQDSAADTNRPNETFLIFDNDYLTSGSGSGATFVIVTDANGDIISVTIDNPGEGFAVNDTITIGDNQLGGDPGNGITITVTAIKDVKSTLYTSGEEDSLILIYDYFKNAWLKWTNVDITGGITLYNEEAVFLSRTRNGSRLNTMASSNTTYDYADHTTAIEFRYETNWESLREPTIPKKFLRLKLYSFDTDNSFESAGFKVNTKIQLNYVPFDLGEVVFDFGQALGWGEEAWGEFRWGSTSLSFLKSKLAPKKSKSLKLAFENKTLNENVLITNYELEIAAPYGMEIKD